MTRFVTPLIALLVCSTALTGCASDGAGLLSSLNASKKTASVPDPKAQAAADPALPTDIESGVRQAQLQRLAGNYDDAIHTLSQLMLVASDDSRVVGTIAAIERNLIIDGLVLRYSTATQVDALPSGEGAFLACSFWLADSYLLTGRRNEAEALFEQLLALGNDVGLFAEEYDPRAKRMLGNFPQALTHMALLNTARLLSMPEEKVRQATAGGERLAAKS